MKRKTLQIVVGLLVVCSLAAYAFLYHAYHMTDTTATASLSEQLLRKLEPNAAPDVSLLKQFMTVLANLLPAS